MRRPPRQAQNHTYLGVSIPLPGDEPHNTLSFALRKRYCNQVPADNDNLVCAEISKLIFLSDSIQFISTHPNLH